MRLSQDLFSFKVCLVYTEEELQIKSQKMQLPERAIFQTFGFVFYHKQLQAVIYSTDQCRAENQNHELFPGLCLIWKESGKVYFELECQPQKLPCVFWLLTGQAALSTLYMWSQLTRAWIMLPFQGIVRKSIILFTPSS